jgi:hypothetical protein
MEVVGLLCCSPSPGAERSLSGRRRQSNELPLNVGTETIGSPFLSVGRPHPIELRQGISQMPSGGERPRPRKSGLAAQRERKTGVNGGGGHGGRCRWARLECEQRPPVDRISRRHQHATAQTQGDEHQCEHETRPARPRPIVRPGQERRSSGARRGDGTLSRRALLEPVQPVENGPCLVGGSPVIDRGLEQPARLVSLAPAERGEAILQELLRLSLALGERAARALDVRPGPRMTPIQEQHAGPDVDRLLVLRREVMIETNEQQLLDLRVPTRIGGGIERSGGVGPERIRHDRLNENAQIIALPLYNLLIRRLQTDASR